MTSIALAIATVFGVGRIPFAPGTFGSAVGLLLWAALSGSLAAEAAAIVMVFIAGSWSGGIAERHYGATDPGAVVIDEVLGMLITLFFNPVGWTGALLGFALFRVFDVIKPYPANRLERLHGGPGIMCDDAMAAVYANMVLRVVIALVPRGLL
jgi:phosphatidylglycerophosphatase A